MIKGQYKNLLLSSTYLLSQIHRYFKDSGSIWLSVFHGRERPTDIQQAIFYYTLSINFIILSYCMHFNRGVDRRLSLLILIMTVLDFIHLFLYAKIGFGFVKIFLSIIIFALIQLKTKKYDI